MNAAPIYYSHRKRGLAWAVAWGVACLAAGVWLFDPRNLITTSWTACWMTLVPLGIARLMSRDGDLLLTSEGIQVRGVFRWRTYASWADCTEFELQRQGVEQFVKYYPASFEGDYDTWLGRLCDYRARMIQLNHDTSVEQIIAKMNELRNRAVTHADSSAARKPA